jgi:hypothetical protein
MSITANKWKSTTVGGEFKNVDYVPTTGSTINANAIFQRDITVGGNIINTILTASLASLSSLITALQTKCQNIIGSSTTLTTISNNLTVAGNLIVGGTVTTSGSTLTITDLNVSNNITAGVNIACGSNLQSTDLAVTGVGYFSGCLSTVNAGFPQMQTS